MRYSMLPASRATSPRAPRRIVRGGRGGRETVVQTVAMPTRGRRAPPPASGAVCPPGASASAATQTRVLAALFGPLRRCHQRADHRVARFARANATATPALKVINTRSFWCRKKRRVRARWHAGHHLRRLLQRGVRQHELLAAIACHTSDGRTVSRTIAVRCLSALSPAACPS